MHYPVSNYLSQAPPQFSMRNASLLVLGKYNKKEFRDVWEKVVNQNSPPRKIISISKSDSLPNKEPSCILIFQSYPGEFQQSLADKLVRTYPFCPILLILGAACQGEERTGLPLRGCFRLFACQWNSFHSSQFELLLQEQANLFTLPKTHKDEDIVLFRAHGKSSQSHFKQRVCVVVENFGPFGNDPFMNRLLVDSFARNGYSVRRCFPHKSILPPHLVVVDSDDSPFSNILQAVQRLRQQFADSEINVYVNSPRMNEKNELNAVGVLRVLSKPLFW